jgi:hypothetical protein
MPSTIAASCALAAGTKIASFLPARFERHGQHAFHRPNAAIKRQLADETEFLEGGAVELFTDGDHSERDRQIEARPFFLNVGRGEVDRRSASGPEITAVADRGGDAIAAFFYRGVGQPHDDYVRIAPGAVDFNFDLVGINTVDRGGINLGQHGGNENVAESPP